jgi:hypothetical protein
MDHDATMTAATVSNLVPTWDEPDGGGAFEPASAGRVVEQVVERAIRVEQLDPDRPPAGYVRRITPPEHFDATERPARRSAYELLDEDESSWAEHQGAAVDDDLPHVDYDLLRRREIAKELLRVRLVRIAEQRHHRSAYEIVFIMLAFAVAVLLTAPPLVQVLLAAHGTQV